MIDDLRAQLAEYDAHPLGRLLERAGPPQLRAPVTDARIWDGVRDAIEQHLRNRLYVGFAPVREYADELTRIALGERVEVDHG